LPRPEKITRIEGSVNNGGGPEMTVGELKKILNHLPDDMPVHMHHQDPHAPLLPFSYNYRVHAAGRIGKRAFYLQSFNPAYIKALEHNKPFPKWAQRIVDNLRHKRDACSEANKDLRQVVQDGGTLRKLPPNADRWKRDRSDWVRTYSRPSDWPKVYRELFWTPREIQQWAEAERRQRRDNQRLERERRKRIAREAAG